MTKKFSPRYTDDDALGRMIAVMKRARIRTGYSQVQFGKLVGISRETVIHIEGFAECSVLSLECEVLKRWYSVCASKLTQQERAAFYEAIQGYLFSGSAWSSFSAENISHSLDNEQTSESTQTTNNHQKRVA